MFKIIKKIVLMSTLLLLTVFAFFFYDNTSAPSSADLVEQHPMASASSLAEEDLSIICPFHRLLKRAGLYQTQFKQHGENVVTVEGIKQAAEKFGCNTFDCGLIAKSVAHQQPTNPNQVILNRLNDVPNISHECGLQFGPGESVVNPQVRESTLKRLKQLANAQGQLKYEDLVTVKQEICSSQGVEKTLVGDIELKVVFAYLGGVDRGYIDHSDVDLFFHAAMPKYKSSKMISAYLLSKAN